MKTTSVTPADLRQVLAVPPLARAAGERRPLDWAENDRVRAHIVDGGIRCLLYGGNAFLYHITLDEYATLLNWLAGSSGDVWAIPSIGPSYGRAMDQAGLLARHRFPCAMLLPCGDPRDAAGLELGAREMAERAGLSLVLYLKDLDNWGSDRERGLDAVARLLDDGVAVAIKYAIVRANPSDDPYLDALLTRVDRSRVVSGMGERPAIVHLRDFGLPGFTTGSGCVAPAGSARILEACASGDFETAERIRSTFMPLEDLRDDWGPARVLHAAVDVAGIARMGPIPPYVSAISEDQLGRLAPVARALGHARAEAPARSV
jgi:dihydrodipicolinate synthase/N-acetylneuraminate lyase